ncbi:uncharacterized protein LOC144100112 [Amblyomma americanum]
MPEDKLEGSSPSAPSQDQPDIAWEVTLPGMNRALGRISACTATGPDGIPARLLKLLGPNSREQLAELFTTIINGGDIPEDWRNGRVVLLLKPGGNAAHIGDYRALTVTSVVYRVFMQVLKAWISGWAESAHVLTELQNGFRPGRRLEDNLFVLTSCTEIARKEGRRLICCFLDVEKAYDNVPHETLFHRLGTLGMAPPLLETIKRLYRENVVTAVFGNVHSERVYVHRGLRQGCPLSPLLYLLYVAGLEKALLQANLGFGLKYSTTGIDNSSRLPGLAFADDLVIMGENTEDVQKMLDICAAELRSLGLKFNQRKCRVVQLAGEANDQLSLTLNEETLTVDRSYKYLGINLCAETDMFRLHEAKVRQSALRAQCILRRRCLWGCHQYTMVRDLWKLAHVPGLTFANAVVCLPSATRNWLERRQTEVGRTAVGCHGRVTNAAIQGDLGWSSFEAREACSKLEYRGRLQFMSHNRWARRVFEYLAATCLRTTWVKRLHKIEGKYGLFQTPISAESATAWKQEARRRVQEKENRQWLQALAEKPTLAVYRECKNSIGPEKIFDNGLGSALLFEARAGALRTLVYRRHFDATPEAQAAICRACGDAEETIEHLVMSCQRLHPMPTEGTTFPQALGFHGPAVDDEGDSSKVKSEGVLRTKRRLTLWWSTVFKTNYLVEHCV